MMVENTMLACISFLDYFFICSTIQYNRKAISKIYIFIVGEIR